MIDLKGANAIVTGGSKGYGSGIAEALGEKGANVFITGRDERALRRTAEETGAKWIRTDATSAGDWDRLVRTVVDATGRIDILVNNAGAGIRIAPLDELGDGEIAESIAVNLTSAILGSKRVVPLMKERKNGVIVNVSSVCASEAWPGWSVYSAAKSGLVQFSKCLYTEVREFGIRVTTLIPSWGATEFLSAAGLADFDPDTKGKVIQPRELGDLVAAICMAPAHIEIQDMTVWPTVQKVVPL